jgi:uncharacterized membrane protein YedE/YeeE
VAVALSAAGFFLARRAGLHARNGETLALTKKPLVRGLATGALLFGVGWGVSGTCPGTALAQIGEGRLAGLITFSGMLLGAWLEGSLGRRRAAADSSTTASASAAAE